MHDLLLDHQDALEPSDLIAYAEQTRPRRRAVRDDAARARGAVRVAEDVDSADLSGVSGTPTFFINGRRHYGAYDIETLSAAVRVARRAGHDRPALRLLRGSLRFVSRLISPSRARHVAIGELVDLHLEQALGFAHAGDGAHAPDDVPE